MQSAKSPSTDYLANEEHILNFLSREFNKIVLEIKCLFRGEKKSFVALSWVASNIKI